MEKYKFIVKLGQIKDLIAKGQDERAIELAGTVDFKKVKNIEDLGNIAALFLRNGMLLKARECYLELYDRVANRNTVMQLINLALRLKRPGEAEKYLREYQKIDKNDFYGLIFRYNIDKLEGKPYKELIPTLEKLKKKEYIEAWAYELAKLYHKAGEVDKCIAECDDLIVFFGEGEYVERAKALRDYYEKEGGREARDKERAEQEALEKARKEELAQENARAVEEAFAKHEEGDPDVTELTSESGEESKEEESAAEDDELSESEGAAAEEPDGPRADTEEAKAGTSAEGDDTTEILASEAGEEKKAVSAKTLDKDDLLLMQLLREEGIEQPSEIIEMDMELEDEDELTEEVQTEAYTEEAYSTETTGSETENVRADEYTEEESEDEVNEEATEEVQAESNSEETTEYVPEGVSAEETVEEEALDEVTEENSQETAEIVQTESYTEEAYETAADEVSEETAEFVPEEISEDETAEEEALDEVAEENSQETAEPAQEDTPAVVTFEFPTEGLAQIPAGSRLEAFLKKNDSELDDFFGYMAYINDIRVQIIKALELILNPQIMKAGIVVTGAARGDMIEIIKGISKVENRSGLMGEASCALAPAEKINRMDLEAKVAKLVGRCLVIEGAGALDGNAVESLLKISDRYGRKLGIILSDSRSSLMNLLRDQRELNSILPVRIHIPTIDTEDACNMARYMIMKGGYSVTRECEQEIVSRIRSLNVGPAEKYSQAKKFMKAVIDAADERLTQAYLDAASDGKRISGENFIEPEDIEGAGYGTY